MVSENRLLRDQEVFAGLPKMHHQPESSGTTEFMAVPQHALTVSEPNFATAHLPSGQQLMQSEHRLDKLPHHHPKYQDQHSHCHHRHLSPNSPHSHHQNHRPEHGHGGSPPYNSDHLSQRHQEQVSANALAIKLANLENQEHPSRTRNTKRTDPGPHQPIQPPTKVLASTAHNDPSNSSSSSPSFTSSTCLTSTQFYELQQRGKKVLSSILERRDQNSAGIVMTTTPEMKEVGATSVERAHKRISPELLKDQQRNLQQHHGSANLRHS